jgi:hypothetical protein
MFIGSLFVPIGLAAITDLACTLDCSSLEQNF